MTVFIRSFLLATLLAAPALAREACYGRSYTPEHLSANPAQQVADMRAVFHVPPKVDAVTLDIRVRFRDDPREFFAYLACWDEGEAMSCVSDDCEAGGLISRLGQDGRLRLSTPGLLADPVEGIARDDGSCDKPGRRDIADRVPGGPTTFLLNARDSRECDWKAPW